MAKTELAADVLQSYQPEKVSDTCGTGLTGPKYENGQGMHADTSQVALFCRKSGGRNSSEMEERFIAPLQGPVTLSVGDGTAQLCLMIETAGWFVGKKWVEVGFGILRTVVIITVFLSSKFIWIGKADGSS
jgi:hypothetical protein